MSNRFNFFVFVLLRIEKRDLELFTKNVQLLKNKSPVWLVSGLQHSRQLNFEQNLNQTVVCDSTKLIRRPRLLEGQGVQLWPFLLSSLYDPVGLLDATGLLSTDTIWINKITKQRKVKRNHYLHQTRPFSPSPVSSIAFMEALCSLLAGRGGSSSGSVSDYGSRGPRFESRWELGFFLFSSLSYISISGAS